MFGWLVAGGVALFTYFALRPGDAPTPSPTFGPNSDRAIMTATNACLAELGGQGCASKASVASFQRAVNMVAAEVKRLRIPDFFDPQYAEAFPLRTDGVVDTSTFGLFAKLTGGVLVGCP